MKASQDNKDPVIQTYLEWGTASSSVSKHVEKQHLGSQEEEGSEEEGSETSLGTLLSEADRQQKKGVGPFHSLVVDAVRVGIQEARKFQSDFQ